MDFCVGSEQVAFRINLKKKKALRRVVDILLN